MKRFALVAAIVLLAAGLALVLSGNFGRGLIHEQLAAQKITFAPYDASGQKGDDYKAYPELRDYAGKQVTDGPTARKFGETYIAAHVAEATGGRTFSEVSSAARANPNDENLAELRRTALDGQLLQAVLWNTFGWWLLATIALWAGIAALVLGAVLLAASLLLGRRRGAVSTA